MSIGYRFLALWRDELLLTNISLEFGTVVGIEWAPNKYMLNNRSHKAPVRSCWTLNKEASTSHLEHTTWTLTTSLSTPSLFSIHQHEGSFSTVIWACHSYAQKPAKLHHQAIKSQVLATVCSSPLLSNHSPSTSYCAGHMLFPIPWIYQTHRCLKASVVAIPLQCSLLPFAPPRSLFSVQSFLLREVFPVFSNSIPFPLPSLIICFSLLHITAMWLDFLFVHLPSLAPHRQNFFFFLIYGSFLST